MKLKFALQTEKFPLLLNKADFLKGLNKMNFEEAYGRLSEISVLMEKSELPLEEAVSLYAEAAKLVELCKKDIENAKLKIEKIENTGK